MSKLLIAFSIIAFWAFLPIALIALDYTNMNDDLSSDDFQKEVPNVLSIGNYFDVFLKIFTFKIAEDNAVINIFSFLMFVLSILTLFLLIRGD